MLSPPRKPTEAPERALPRLSTAIRGYPRLSAPKLTSKIMDRPAVFPRDSRHGSPIRRFVTRISEWGRSLIEPSERGHSCPQQAPNARRFLLCTGLFPTRTLLRTGMFALRFRWAVQMRPPNGVFNHLASLRN